MSESITGLHCKFGKGKSEKFPMAQLLVCCTTFCKVLALYLKQTESNKWMPDYYLDVSYDLCSWKQVLVSLELTEGVLNSCLIEQGVLNSSRTAKTIK